MLTISLCMKQFLIVISALFLFQLFAGCSGGTNSNDSQTNIPTNRPARIAKNTNDNVKELGMIVKLPAEPEDVLWREETLGSVNRSPGPADRKLTAVIFFESGQTDKIVADAEALGPVSEVTVEAADWFPSELITQSELSGGPLKGLSYPADNFLQTPYTSGRLIRVEGTEYLILELSTK